jgi:hypothetical protein
MYSTPAEYKTHFERVYCRGVITTFDGIRVYFSSDKFGHCFYESSRRDGVKDIFSSVRAERIDWIRATLESREASIFQGWNKGSHSPVRRVAVVYEDFVVVIQMGLKQDGSLKATFVTCYQADNSIGKIRSSPAWTREDCIERLERKGR